MTVVIPCLNEEETVAACVRIAAETMRLAGISGEVVIADNGSTDASRERALAAGARVIKVTERGYGAALLGGIAAADGDLIVMGDADGSYDFREIPSLVDQLRKGADIVVGCRFPSGGGTIRSGAMPFLHRWLGNPLLTLLARRMFRLAIRDIYCGLRAFRREFVQRLDLRCTGMEFAAEMLVKAGLSGGRIAEIPITLHPDARTKTRSHLRTMQDGSRTVRTYLLYSPNWLFVAPGMLATVVGVAGYVLVYSRTEIFGATLDAHTLLVASLVFLLGIQAMLFGFLAKLFAIGDGLLPSDRRTVAILRALRPTVVLWITAVSLMGGLGLLVDATWRWAAADFGNLDYSSTMRLVVPAVTLIAFAFQTACAGLFAQLLLLGRRAASLEVTI
ncbi:MAG: glycosyltransferase family 2 protein [Thermoanaerobaculia bacterium]